MVGVALVLHDGGDGVDAAPKAEVQLLEAVVGHAVDKVQQEEVLEAEKHRSAQ